MLWDELGTTWILAVPARNIFAAIGCVLQRRWTTEIKRAAEPRKAYNSGNSSGSEMGTKQATITTAEQAELEMHVMSISLSRSPVTRDVAQGSGTETPLKRW